MNTELLNEILEARVDGCEEEFIQEKFAELEVTEEDFPYLCDKVNEILEANEEEKTAKANFARVVAGLGLGTIGAAAMGGFLVNRHKTKRSYDQALNMKPELKKDPKTKEHFDMLVHVAPTVMQNPTVAASMLEQIAQYDMVDHQMLSKLIDAEKNMTDAKTKSGFMAGTKDIAQTMGHVTDMANIAQFGGKIGSSSWDPINKEIKQ